MKGMMQVGHVGLSKGLEFRVKRGMRVLMRGMMQVGHMGFSEDLTA